MKFPKPRHLLKNEHPDLIIDQPETFQRLIRELIYPIKNSKRDRYLDETIKNLKDKAKNKAKIAKLNEIFINKELYFLPIYIKSRTDPNKIEEIKCLIDTGAANSLIQYDIAKSIGLKFEPAKITLKTATGEDSESIKGITHQKIYLQTSKGKTVGTCVNLIITKKLNDLDLILGADFLFMNEKIKAISKTDLTWQEDDMSKHKIKISDEMKYKNKKINKTSPESIKKSEVPDCRECENIKTKLKKNGTLTNKKEEISTNTNRLEEKEMESKIEINRLENLENESLPPSESAFEEQLELDFKILDKKLSLEDADYSECPVSYTHLTLPTTERV